MAKALSAVCYLKPVWESDFILCHLLDLRKITQYNIALTQQPMTDKWSTLNPLYQGCEEVEERIRNESDTAELCSNVD